MTNIYSKPPRGACDTITHLVDVVQSDDGIEERVEVVEEVDHLDGVAESRDGGEAHDVAEVQRDLTEMLGFDGFARLQRLSHGPEGGRRQTNQ